MEFEDVRRTVSASPGPYQDMGPRNLTGSGREEVQKLKAGMFDELTKKILKRICQPARTQEEFDEWHKETCGWLVEKLKSLCKKNKESDIDVKPGQAQKLINMTFKHIFCFKDAAEAAYNGAFQFCHMPVDQYVLSWYYREIFGKIYNEGNGWLKWKHLEYRDYMAIQRNVRSYLESERNYNYRAVNGMPLTAFETEFYIWNEEMLIRALYKCRQELENEQSRKWMKCGTMKKYMEEIREILEKSGIT